MECEGGGVGVNLFTVVVTNSNLSASPAHFVTVHHLTDRMWETGKHHRNNCTSSTVIYVFPSVSVISPLIYVCHLVLFMVPFCFSKGADVTELNSIKNDLKIRIHALLFTYDY